MRLLGAVGGPAEGRDRDFTGPQPAQHYGKSLGAFVEGWIFASCFQGKGKGEKDFIRCRQLVLGAGAWNLSWEGRHVKAVGTGGWGQCGGILGRRSRRT